MSAHLTGTLTAARNPVNIMLRKIAVLQRGHAVKAVNVADRHAVKVALDAIDLVVLKANVLDGIIGAIAIVGAGLQIPAARPCAHAFKIVVVDVNVVDLNLFLIGIG